MKNEILGIKERSGASLKIIMKNLHDIEKEMMSYLSKEENWNMWRTLSEIRDIHERIESTEWKIKYWHTDKKND